MHQDLSEYFNPFLLYQAGNRHPHKPHFWKLSNINRWMAGY
jgi:hypothetical protein